jgi:hypothetical protein
MDFYTLIRCKIRTALTLSWSDWWILAQAWVLLLAVDLGLRALPFRRVQELLTLGRKDADDLQAGGALATVQRLGWLVGVAGRNHLYPMGCLRRSLVLQWLLGRRGIITDLQIGVRKEVDELNAHAWLEYEGQPLGEPQAIAVHYAPLAAQEAG